MAEQIEEFRNLVAYSQTEDIREEFKQIKTEL